MKIAALDIGDVWTGTALSDPLRIIARPYQTVKSEDLITFLHKLFNQEKITTIVIGYPKTMRGTESDQTRKVVGQKELLSKTFPDKNWVLWDERLTSKQADKLKHAKTKEDKIASHSIAAAFILESYLPFAQNQN